MTFGTSLTWRSKHHMSVRPLMILLQATALVAIPLDVCAQRREPTDLQAPSRTNSDTSKPRPDKKHDKAYADPCAYNNDLPQCRDSSGISGKDGATRPNAAHPEPCPFNPTLPQCQL